MAAPILTEPPGNSIAAGVATAGSIDAGDDVLADLMSSEFVLSGSRAEAFGSPLSVRVETERPTAGGNRTGRAAPGSPATFPAGSEEGSDAVTELARSYLNVAPRSRAAGASGSPTGRGSGQTAGSSDPDRVDWLRDALLQVVGNALQQNVNERGEVTFSLLGFGEFGLMVSSDRSIVSLTQGDNVLLIADRRSAADPAAAQPGEPMADLNAGPLTPVGRSATVEPQPESGGLIQRLLDIMIELLTHPVGMLFVAVVIGLGLIAKIFSSRGKRRRSGRHRSRHRTSVPLETTAPPERKSRSRRRRSSGRSHGESESTQRA